MGSIINHSQHLHPPHRRRLDHHCCQHNPNQHLHGLDWHSYQGFKQRRMVNMVLSRTMHWVRLGQSQKHGKKGG